MRTAILILCFTAFALTGWADMGSSYSMQATFKMKDGRVLNGYFLLATYDLSIDRDQDGWLVGINGQKVLRLKSQASDPINIDKSEYKFGESVIKALYDSVEIFKDVVLLNGRHIFAGSEGRIAVMIAPGIKVAKADISVVTVKEVYFQMIGMAIDSKCTKGDLTWLKKSVVESARIGEVTLCGYTAVFFEERSEDADKQFEILKVLYDRQAKLADGSQNVSYEVHQALQLQINEAVDALQKLHVLVVSSCSC